MMQHTILSLALLAMVLGASAQTVVVEPSSVYAPIGSNYSLVCTCESCQADLQFMFDNSANVPDPSRYTVTSGVNATLVVTNVAVSDARILIMCQTVVGQHSIPVGVTVYVASVTNGSAEIDVSKTAMLTVNVYALNNALGLGTWYQGQYPSSVKLDNNTGGYVTYLSSENITGSQYYYNYTYQLLINKPTLQQAGQYYVLLIESAAAYVNAYLNILPVLLFEPAPDGGRSYSAYDGSNFSVSCLAQGYPLPTGVSWTVQFENGQPSVDASSWSRAVLSSNRLNQTAGTLTIANIDYSERATYTCMAINSVGNSSVGYLVRVKDPLAALWPAIGVLVEIIVLAAIIILYEKFKDRFSSADSADDDEGDVVQGRSDGNSHSQRSDVELRQRNAH